MISTAGTELQVDYETPELERNETNLHNCLIDGQSKYLILAPVFIWFPLAVHLQPDLLPPLLKLNAQSPQGPPYHSDHHQRKQDPRQNHHPSSIPPPAARPAPDIAPAPGVRWPSLRSPFRARCSVLVRVPALAMHDRL